MEKLKEEFKQNGGEWKKVTAESLFEVKGNPQLNRSSFIFTEVEEYPYFTRTVLNNGISGYVEYLDEEHKIKGQSIAVGMLGMQFFYMEKDFYAGQFTKTLFPKFTHFNKKIALYFISMLNRNQEVYQSMLVRDFEKTFNETLLTLPFLNGEIYFSYMEKYIEELEALHIEELEGYLSVTGLKDYSLTEEDKKILDEYYKMKDNSSYKQTDRELKLFKVDQIFDISTPKHKFNANAIKFGGKYPYVARGESDNGIRGYISEDEKFLNNGNTISFGQDTATMFYQRNPYFTGDKIKIFTVKEVLLDKHIAMCLITSVKRTLETFTWGSTSYNVKNLKEIMLELPSIGGKVDYDYLTKLNRSIEKLVIRDLVIWADKKIEATKKVANLNN